MNKPKIKLIIPEIGIMTDKRKIIPAEKSIQLAKSFKNPKQDLANKIIPNPTNI